METAAKTSPTVSFETSPEQYRHWKLAFAGPIASLSMDVREDAGLQPDYRLKLNSYDLGVDIELADAIQRLRFEHPGVRCLIVESAKDRIFCAGANINMLATSGHAFKVNFCKFTNETRIGIEDMSARSGVKSLAALNGVCAGGGYELALACDEIVLVDDGNSAVSLPEVPLLAVLPGTGGLTRVVDKRKVRRLGGQGALWGEFIWSGEDVEYFAFPRAAALSEVLWSPAEARDFERFKQRLPQHLHRLESLGVNYRRDRGNNAVPQP